MTPPSTACSARTCATSGARPATAPASRSLWPARYLVAECSTRSAPSASARWLHGVANVLSMHTMAPFAWHAAEMARTSTQRRYGLVGDSEKNSVTGPFTGSSSAACSAAMSLGSMTVVVMPILGSSVWMNWRVRR